MIASSRVFLSATKLIPGVWRMLPDQEKEFTKAGIRVDISNVISIKFRYYLHFYCIFIIFKV